MQRTRTVFSASKGVSKSRASEQRSPNGTRRSFVKTSEKNVEMPHKRFHKGFLRIFRAYLAEDSKLSRGSTHCILM